MSYPIRHVEEAIRLRNWCDGTSKRTSRDGTVFLTRKNKRIYDRAYLESRDKFRYNGPCYSRVRRRRAKSTWGPRHEET